MGSLTATAAVGNLYFSRRNLEQQHIIEERRFQDEALQAYYTQLGDLLTEHALKKTKPEDDVALLARAQTLTVVRRLDASRKGDLVRFLYGAGLISGDGAIVDLFGANLFGADLVGADLSGVNLRGVNLALAHLSGAADLRRADLSEAKLSWADLVGANLFGANLQGANLFGALLRHADLGHADLSGVNLRDADLRYADLRDARNVTEEQLEEQAASLKGATMPNGQMYEEWIK